MRINYHIHTSRSGDVGQANGKGETPRKYIEAAKKAGISEICLTDHLVVGYPNTLPLYSHSMGVETLDPYCEEIDSLAEEYPELKLKKGVEVDWLPGKAGEIRKVLKKHPFDCVLGSVHFIKGTYVEHGRNRDEFWGRFSSEGVHERYAAYYTAVQQMAESKICDVVAHLDLIKRDGYFPERSVLHFVKETLDVMSDNNLCIEVNTSGMRKPIREMHPSLEILKLCKKKGIPVTIGTDAHKADEIDSYLDEGIGMIKKAGYAELAVFEKRRIGFVEI